MTNQGAFAGRKAGGDKKNLKTNQDGVAALKVGEQEGE